MTALQEVCTRLLIDADPLVYALGFTVSDPETDANTFRRRIKYTVAGWLQDAPDALMRPELYLTDGRNNFRNDIAKYAPYKGNRQDLEKPAHYNMIRDVMLEDYGAIIEYDQEADDRIVIEHQADPSSIMASVDKDFLTKSGRHLRLGPNGGVYREVGEFEAMHFFYTQLLTGDPTDHIIGLEDLGPVAAADFLRDCKTEAEMYQRCVEIWELDGFDEARVIENATLLHLRRYHNEIWTPPR